MLTVIGTPPSGLTSSTGVYLDGADNGGAGTNYVTTITGNILAGPAPELLCADAKRYAFEARMLARIDARGKADPHRSPVIPKHETTAGHLVASHSKLVTQDARIAVPSASAVDMMMTRLGSDPVSFLTILKQNRTALLQRLSD